MMNRLKDVAVPVKAAEKMTPEQLEGKIITGVLHKVEKPDYTSEYAKVIERAKK
jgi:2-oxoglutarate/2-oxoacid ferredoxin oxidoreductase subunit beta